MIKKCLVMYRSPHVASSCLTGRPSRDLNYSTQDASVLGNRIYSKHTTATCADRVGCIQVIFQSWRRVDHQYWRYRSHSHRDWIVNSRESDACPPFSTNDVPTSFFNMFSYHSIYEYHTIRKKMIYIIHLYNTYNNKNKIISRTLNCGY